MVTAKDAANMAKKKERAEPREAAAVKRSEDIKVSDSIFTTRIFLLQSLQRGPRFRSRHGSNRLGLRTQSVERLAI